ncbi:MAG: tetratricopeptide (TPR) repeat protein, partial [Candidatus Krumholzibacteriia bacterium]
AAQAEGGDIRGQQSAAILVVSAKATGEKWVDVLVDLRVEDHAAPVEELSRLLEIHRGYALMNDGDLAVENGDLKGADYFYGEAQRILKDNLEAEYWHAVALVNAGNLDSSLPLFGKIFYADENWRRLIPRLVKAELLLADAESVARIMTVIPAQK